MYKVKLVSGVEVLIRPKVRKIKGRVKGQSPQFLAYDLGGQKVMHTTNPLAFIQLMEEMAWDDSEVPEGVINMHTVMFVVAHFFDKQWAFSSGAMWPEVQDVQRYLGYAIVDAALKAGDFRFCKTALKNIIDMATRLKISEDIVIVN